MRELAKGGTKAECQQNIDRLKKQGYEPITNIKLDDSFSAHNNIRYVCVMEKEGTRSATEKGFNRGRYQW